MVGSPRSRATRENHFRGQEASRRKENPGKEGLPRAGAWEERLSKQALPLDASKSTEAPGKKGDLGPELQSNVSSKGSKHLFTQCLVRHWAVLHGLITSVGPQGACSSPSFTDRLEGCSAPSCQGVALAPGAGSYKETSPEWTMGMFSHPSGSAGT